jgi:hypothetical protein
MRYHRFLFAFAFVAMFWWVCTACRAEAPPGAGSTISPAKAAVPDVAVLSEALKLVREAHGPDFVAAKKAEEKAALANKLLREASGEKDALSRFALLSLARDSAVDAGDFTLTLKVIGEIDRIYLVDVLKLKVDAVALVVKALRTVEDRKQLIAQFSELIDQAIAIDRFDSAKQMADLTLIQARLTTDNALVREATLHVQQVREFEHAFGEVKPALTILVEKPTDPVANMTVGRYRCYMLGDWETGLPMLALANESAAKTLATQELAGPKSPDEQAKLGDGLWDLSDKEDGTAKKRLQEHASGWYLQAVDKLEGIAKLRVEKRLAMLKRAEGSRWTVLFRSADPSIWDTNIHTPDAFAVSLDQSSKQISFLRLTRVATGEAIIISMTKDRLKSPATPVSPKSNVGWEGERHKDWNAYRLGVYEKTETDMSRGCPQLVMLGKTRGWGFGVRYRDGDRQGYGWAGKEIEHCVFEIAVIDRLLTAEEKKLLKE